MKEQKQSMRARIQTLLKQKTIIIPTSPTSNPPTSTTNTTNNKDKQLSTSGNIDNISYTLVPYVQTVVPQSSLVNKIVGGVVIGKNEQNKQLLIHLTVVYEYAGNNTGNYNHNTYNNKQKYIATNINSNKYIGYIKDYQLKANSSIFGYLNNFKDITIGSFINAWVRRLQKSPNISNNNSNNKTYFQLHLNRQIQAKDKDSANIKLGVMQDNIKIPQSVLKVYEKQHSLPMNFLLLYTQGYENPGLQRTFQTNLKTTALGSLNKISNLPALQAISYNYNRIRYRQEILWRDQHLELGIQCIQDAKYKQAIQCFNISIKFGHDAVEARIAKACALANMNNIIQGIKQIKEVLKIQPGNQRARRYYQQFQKEIGFRSEENLSSTMKKRISNFDIVRKR